MVLKELILIMRYSKFSRIWKQIKEKIKKQKVV